VGKGLMGREIEILGTFGRNVDTVRIYIFCKVGVC